jgi:hypothetical protein
VKHFHGLAGEGFCVDRRRQRDDPGIAFVEEDFSVFDDFFFSHGFLLSSNQTYRNCSFSAEE